MKIAPSKLTTITLLCFLACLAVGQRIKDLPEKLALVDTNAFEVVQSGLTNLGSYRVSYGSLSTNLAARLGVPAAPSSGGVWLLDEEFLGDTTTRSYGREAWLANIAGGGVVDLSTNFPGSLAVKGLIVTNAADRAGMNVNANLNGTTNVEMFFCSRVAIGTLDFAGASNSFQVGISDSVTSEASNGIYFKNQSNQWYACTARLGTRTIHLLLSNAVADAWINVAWHLESNQTNVNFYIGATPETLVFQTNINVRVPNTPGILMAAMVKSHKQIGATERMTNYVDNFRLWARRL